MARKKIKHEKRVAKDLKFNSDLVMKIICMMTFNGKKSMNTASVHQALEILSKKVEAQPLEALHKVMENVSPGMEVRSRRVGGATYQVPIEVPPHRSRILALRWLIRAARSRSGTSWGEKFARELIDAYNNTGSAVKKKEDLYRMAEANRAFAHYR